MPHRPHALPRIDLRGAPFEIGLRYGQQALYAGQVYAKLLDEVLDQAQTLDLFPRVQPYAAHGAARLHQAEPLVLPQRLRVHVEHARDAADEVKFLFHVDGPNLAMIRI